MRSEQQQLELSLAVIEDLKRQGYNQSEIAEVLGVTRQAISWWQRTYGKRTPRQTVLEDHFPWKVPAPLGQSSPYRRLRDHGEFVATGGIGMSVDKLVRLRAFYRKLRDEGLVVEFDPDIPPEPGVSSRGGWRFRKRTAEDADLLIRVNEHTNLTTYGRMIWRFPSWEPIIPDDDHN